MRSKTYIHNPAISQSDLKHILRGPDEFLWHKENIDYASTGSMELGKAVHIYLFEPHMGTYILRRPDIEPRTRKEKIFKLLESGKDITYLRVTTKIKKNQEEGFYYEVDEEEKHFARMLTLEYGDYFENKSEFIMLSKTHYEKALAMSCSIRKNQDTMDLIYSGCEFEKEYFYTHKDINFKAQLDCVGHDFVLDLKTTICVNSDRELIYTIRNYLYHFQAASYLTASQKENYYIIFVRSEPPYSVIPVKLSFEMLDEGKMLFDKACDLYNDCLVFNPEFKCKNKMRIL